MGSSSNYKWLAWAKRLEAIAQIGLTFTEGAYDIERYKSLRAIAAEIMATYSNVEPSYVLDLFSQDMGYATPKVDVRAAVFDSDKLLFVKEKVDGCWTIPGGWADVGDSPGDAAVREVQEESGYLTRAVKLLAVYDRDKQGHPPFPYAVYRLYFLCELIGGSPSSSIETDEVAFFGEDEIPELSLSRVLPTQIARIFHHHRHPDLPTDFD
ncbi:MAG: NUDIX hydrolase [Chroococcidiopsidaceae cyanobacterium CP_BM_ER_R8_30]|nr:NUDIX hydrolase [Chroococcidiopsidaceae cyanobacterium CP_BM_ER_R8_30]